MLSELSRQRKGDRLGLLVFGSAPYLQAPFTEDHVTWLRLLEETEIGMAGQSTVFGDAIGLAIKRLRGDDGVDPSTCQHSRRHRIQPELVGERIPFHPGARSDPYKRH